MSQLLLVGNPAKRRRSGKTRTAAQKRATAKLVALNKRRRSGSSVAVRANPAPKRRRRRAVTTAKVSRRIRRARRNPIAGLDMRGITNQLKTAGIGAAGAVGVDVLFGFVQSYLPTSMQTEASADGSMNVAYYAAKSATAIGAGLLLNKMIGANKAAAVVEGSLIVTLYKAAARFMANNVPSVTLGSYVPGGRQAGVLPFSQNLRGVGMQVSRSARVHNAPNQNLRGVGEYVGASHRERAIR